MNTWSRYVARWKLLSYWKRSKRRVCWRLRFMVRRERSRLQWRGWQSRHLRIRIDFSENCKDDKNDTSKPTTRNHLRLINMNMCSVIESLTHEKLPPMAQMRDIPDGGDKQEENSSGDTEADGILIPLCALIIYVLHQWQI